jgi:hypothetical protein
MKNSKFQNRDKIISGLELAYQRMIEFKKRKGTPIIQYKDGKVIEVNPNEAPPTVKYTKN